LPWFIDINNDDGKYNDGDGGKESEEEEPKKKT
jgi:hypothetical protein